MLLCHAMPCRAVLCCAVLCCAVLCCAVLCCAVLGASWQVASCIGSMSNRWAMGHDCTRVRGEKKNIRWNCRDCWTAGKTAEGFSDAQRFCVQQTAKKLQDCGLPD